MAELEPQLAIVIVQAGDRGQLGMEDFRSPPARHVSKRRVQCSRDSFGCHAEFKRNDIRPQVVIGTRCKPPNAAPHHRLPDPSHRSHPSTHACSGVRMIVRAGRAAVNAGETCPIGLEIASSSHPRRRYRRARRLEWDADARAGPAISLRATRMSGRDSLASSGFVSSHEGCTEGGSVPSVRRGPALVPLD